MYKKTKKKTVAEYLNEKYKKKRRKLIKLTETRKLLRQEIWKNREEKSNQKNIAKRLQQAKNCKNHKKTENRQKLPKNDRNREKIWVRNFEKM